VLTFYDRHNACSEAFLDWMERHYNGIYRGKDFYDNWLFYASKATFVDIPRREAMLFMLLVACNPRRVPRDSRAALKKCGWRGAQINAMAPFAAFHAARITVLWQATAKRATPEQAIDDTFWTVLVPDDELW
jgi:hypothetical protein